MTKLARQLKWLVQHSDPRWAIRYDKVMNRFWCGVFDAASRSYPERYEADTPHKAVDAAYMAKQEAR